MSQSHTVTRSELGPNKLKKAHMMSRLFLVLMRATRLQVFEPFFNRHKTLLYIAGTGTLQSECVTFCTSMDFYLQAEVSVWLHNSWN